MGQKGSSGEAGAAAAAVAAVAAPAAVAVVAALAAVANSQKRYLFVALWRIRTIQPGNKHCNSITIFGEGWGNVICSSQPRPEDSSQSVAKIMTEQMNYKLKIILCWFS